MASNNYTISDENGEFDDWVELYNPTDDDIDLAGSFMSDDLADLMDWQIPFGSPELTTIEAGGFLLFWADNDTLQGANHLGFTLSGGGEQIALTLPNGEIIVDAFQFFTQENDISYGRIADGDPDFQFFNIPTPNATNVDVQPEPMDLHINEIQAVNNSTHFDGSMEYDPWIELYNPNDEQVNLANYTLVYNNGESEYVFPADAPSATVIESNDFKVIWCDNQDFQGPKHTNFFLANSGSLELIANDGVTSVEMRTYSNLQADESTGSEVDGGDDYVTFSVPTPDVTNSIVFIQPEPLFINEVMSSNLTDTLDNFQESEDWIEIYNPNNYPVDLSGYHLSDNYGGDTYEIPSTYPDSVTVPANGFLLFWADNDDEQGVRHTNFKFSSDGDDAVILAPDSFTIADFKILPLIATDDSYGRQTDGGNVWTYFTPDFTTPESSNEGPNNVPQIELNLISFFPNPAKSFIQFNAEVAQLRITDSSGRLVYSYPLCKEVDLSSFNSGVYVISAKGLRPSRLIVE